MEHCCVLTSLEGMKDAGSDGFHIVIPAKGETWERVGKPGCFCNIQPTQPGMGKSFQLSGRLVHKLP